MLIEYSPSQFGLYVDNDLEEFEFLPSSRLEVQRFFKLWLASLKELKEKEQPVMLPVYLERTNTGLDVQGYILYPNDRSWIMVDSGVIVPPTDDLGSLNKHLPPKEQLLPARELEWQSHWYVSGKDLTELSAQLGYPISFTDQLLPCFPIVATVLGDQIEILVGKHKYIAKRVQASDISGLVDAQIRSLTTGKSECALIPLSADSQDIEFLCLFKSDYWRTAIGYVRRVFEEIETDIENAIDQVKKGNAIYRNLDDPLTYHLSARYRKGSESNLVAAFHQLYEINSN